MESHVAAGHPNSGAGTDNGGGHFVSTETVSRVGSGDRTVPDAHLTRFAAYFVALNADQSKPEVRTLARLVRHYGPYAPEFSDTAQERARSRPRGGPRRCGRRPEAVRGKARGGAGGAPPLGRGTGIGWGHAGGTAGTRRGTGGGHAGTRRIHGAFPGTLRTCRGRPSTSGLRVCAGVDRTGVRLTPR